MLTIRNSLRLAFMWGDETIRGSADIVKYNMNYRSGWVTATDADTGRVIWKFVAGAPVVSGVTPTKGGLGQPERF